MARFSQIAKTTRPPEVSGAEPGSVGFRQREKIIRAATDVFSRKGYDGARVEEIAQCAGLPKGNVLYKTSVFNKENSK
jgi:DNA-binding transcriptional regulator YbjK